MTRRELIIDAGLALALLVVGLVGSVPAGDHQPEAVALGSAGFALIVVAILPLVVRRKWPLVTLAVTVSTCSAYLMLGYPYGPILLAVLVAVYTVALRLPLRGAMVAGLLALIGLLLHTVVGRNAPMYSGIVPGSAWVIVPFAVGVAVRISREAVERSRAEVVRQRAYEERLSIAQEVHDVVGHGLAAINMQAEIALHLLPKRPEQAGEALTAISRTSKQALDELRVTLAVVRRSGDTDDRAPVPGLARLDDLVARMRDTGVPVTVQVAGEPRSLPAAVDLAAYRIVQESLTNVLRHAGPATATVRLIHDPAGLTVRITDTGRIHPNGSTGHGILGMRERVSALGGTFEAGPATSGGFRVQATFPLQETRNG